MRKHKTITISLPTEMVDYLDQRIAEINRNTFEETNRSKYIRFLIRKDMSSSTLIKSSKTVSSPAENPSQEMEYYHSLLELGGYKR
ncbi:Arc/MetJ-type ribon-helix-helix transcriptional regulator [Desulfohalotomaculum tongense]|uniref:ribbon-helix-helix domain-containing protein n=1 Tax=Desulforadius tongensis TaxID=1216062 RepID=UPI00195BC44A|nr:ribbon-helix-helix domain-containing protein [Desulforadius tongensis]MBM7855678.1 Arc/MetJ-type ribon-helix-helix transcriptional regulator [Desulforadius tongensis]